MKYKTVIFDFDGTIADTQQAQLDSLNALASEFGFEPIGAHELPSLKGEGARHLLKTRLGIPLWRVRKIVRLERRGRQEFKTRLEGIRLFPGMAEVIARLRQEGSVVGIISSNTRPNIEKLLASEGVMVDFIHGGSRILGKARGLRHAFRAEGIDVAQSVYIGDELRDVDACKRLGISMIGVAWGFNSAESLAARGAPIAKTPQELQEMLLGSL